MCIRDSPKTLFAPPTCQTLAPALYIWCNMCDIHRGQWWWDITVDVSEEIKRLKSELSEAQKKTQSRGETSHRSPRSTVSRQLSSRQADDNDHLEDDDVRSSSLMSSRSSFYSVLLRSSAWSSLKKLGAPSHLLPPLPYLLSHNINVAEGLS